MRIAYDHPDIQSVPLNLWELRSDEIPPLLLRPEQAAKVLNVSRSKVFFLIKAGALRSMKSGGSRRITRNVAKLVRAPRPVKQEREPLTVDEANTLLWSRASCGSAAACTASRAS